MRKLLLPLSEQDILSLRTGEQILISGTLYTARDAAHKRLVEDNFVPEETLHTVYYVGPTSTPPNKIIGSAGPTTATRMDKYSDYMAKIGTRVVIGKGKRSSETKEIFLNNRMIYLIAIGGLGALLSKCIIKNKTILYSDLGPEAIRRLEVKDFPVIVGFDTKGVDIYE